MFKYLIRLFLFIHILGDFYLQSEQLADKKSKSYKYVFLHGVIYLVVSVLCVLPFYSFKLLIASIVFCCLHLIIDLIKFIYIKEKEETVNLYIVDQTLHILSLLTVVFYLVFQDYDLVLIEGLANIFEKSKIDVSIIFLWLLLVLILAKPLNITIKQLLDKYKVKDDLGIENAGAFIGTLERIIIVLLISINQFSTIGLVLTAKSVARYNKIAEDKQFAEYYLLGTLLSTLFALVIFFFLI